MRWIGAEELRKACDLASLIEALDAGHRRPRAEIADSLIGPEDARYLVRSAHDGLELLGSKLITIVPANREVRAIPSVQAVIILFDATDGRPRAAMDATDLTYWKTAADSALGARYLARGDARRLLLVGAGGLAPWLLRGHLCVRPEIDKVDIWNRAPARAEDLAARLQGEGIAAQAVADLEGAVTAADIVTTATMAREPLVRGEWLKPGAHVDLVGGFAPDMREADDETLKRARLFVDCRESASEGVGDIAIPLASAVISDADILGDLYDLAGGGIEARRDDKEITVFKNAGGAHLDLMVAAALLERVEAGSPGGNQ